MREIITTGKSLESIREEWSSKWACSPGELTFDVIEKPSVFNRFWKVKVSIKEDSESNLGSGVKISWDGEKYTINPGMQIESIAPFPTAGKLVYGGNEIDKEFSVQKGDVFEFYPETKKGGLTWQIEVKQDGSQAWATVKHEQSGKYKLTENISHLTRLSLERLVSWESIPDSEESRTEEDFKRDLSGKGILCGLKPNIWVDFLTGDGEKTIVIAEATPPVQPIQPQLIDYVGEPVFEEEGDENTIDYFACKLKICQKDEVLAKKIPGKEGVPGINVFGKILPVENYRNFEFKLKKNVYLSEDGLEVRASCSGTPLRVNNYTYLVENAYILNSDINLETGSIDFPGDVFIGRDIKDGLYVYSGGKITVQGSVSSADIKAEAGLTVFNNTIASHIVVGEKHVFRSQLVKGLKEVQEELNLCINQVKQLQNASGNTNTGQLLKVLLEKNFSQLPNKAEELEGLLRFKDPDFMSPELEVAVKTVKHFLTGLGPLQLKNPVYLTNALKVISYFLSTKGELIPSSVICDTNYVQNSEISCAGDFICKKGIYNSMIKIEGNIKILGVCRGGEINCSGNIYIWELGGSCMSATTIRAAKNSRISVDYSHPNIKIYVGKELVRIDEGVQKLDIYREKAILQVEKLKWDGRNENR
ncbi:MAG: hypothetical protein AWM53_00527 [Candidatus Dichloromethanomonas elyunquensis]|nr:MAG: hypothetical protein AWM53_00527 [Candidatus Dichloromethanomonas elyunquensis]